MYFVDGLCITKQVIGHGSVDTRVGRADIRELDLVADIQIGEPYALTKKVVFQTIEGVTLEAHESQVVDDSKFYPGKSPFVRVRDELQERLSDSG